MGKISKIFNFDNIGGKIKNLAKWSCWITILLLWIFAAICAIIMIAGGTPEQIFYMIVIALVGPFVVWIGSWTMYAFGEFVERTCDNEDNTRLILEKLTPPKTIKTVIDPIIPARTDKPSKKTVGEGEYVSGRTYTKGDSVIFEDKKYICVGSSTVWSPGVAPSQWQEIDSDEVR